MGAKMYDGKLAVKANMRMKTQYVNENVAFISAWSYRREEFLRAFRVMDEQDAINRYHWYNIPAEISSQEIERMLYFKGQVCFFYFKELKKFYFMPYALDGSIDFYGRYNTIHPVPFSSGTEPEDKSLEAKARKLLYDNQKAILSQMKLQCYYDVVDEGELSEEEMMSSTVLLHDYCKQRAENVIPRSVINDIILNEMADTISYFDTALLTSSGVSGYRVESAAAKKEIENMSSAIYQSAINRTPYVAVTGSVDWQEISEKASYGVQEYLMAFQGLDNLRLSTYGIANGGVYEKQAHILESEMEINNSSVYSPLEDGLKIRQRFCNIVNSIFGTSIWCEPSEAALKTDLNGDGVEYDREVDEESEPAEQEEGGKE